MSSKSRSRRSTVLRLVTGGLAVALSAAALVIVPSSPAAAIQTIAWTTPPPSTATVGQAVSFAWTGTANTFLGARITGCFATFPDAPQYTNSFGGNFTTGNCTYTNRVVTAAPTYTVTVGFHLSTGGTMSQTWTINTQAPAPAVVTSGDVVTTATSIHGAPATFSAYGHDSLHGTYPAVCDPLSGSTFQPGTTTVHCTATNPSGRVGSSNLSVTVIKATPVITWSPPVVIAGRPLDTALDATVSPAGIPGALSYTDADGHPLTSFSVLAAGTGQLVHVTFTPTGPGANAFHPATTTRTIDALRLSQTVTFGPAPADASVDDAPFEVTAAGTDGGGAVTISAVMGSACTVTDHSTGTAGAATVEVTGGGTCVLQARQAQTATYAASPVVERSVTVARRTPVTSWTPDTVITYGASLADLLDATADAPGTWTYHLDGDVVDADSVPGAGEDRTLTAMFQPADPDRHTTATESRTLTVLRAPQELVVAPIADRTYRDGPFDVVTTGAGPGRVILTVAGPCSVDGLTVTPTAAGDCVVTAAKAGDADHLPASAARTVHVAKDLPTLTWRTPAAIAHGTPLGDAQLDAAMSPADATGTVDYFLADGVTPARGALLRTGAAQQLTARYWPDQAASERYLPTWGSVTIDVTKAQQVITLGALPDQTYGDPVMVLRGTGGASGNAVAYAATGACTVAGDRLSLVRAGTCTVTASQAGSDDYDAAPSVTRLLTVDRARLTVTAPSATRRYGAEQPVLAPAYTGFVNADTVADLTEPATCTTSAKATSPAGTYDVTCAGASSADYAVTATTGRLRVRYGMRGFTWALEAGRAAGRFEHDTRTRVRIHLRDAHERALPGRLMARIGSTCSATLTVGAGKATCFSFAPKTRRLVAVLDTRAVSRRSVVPVVVEVRAADGTLARRRTAHIRVR